MKTTLSTKTSLFHVIISIVVAGLLLSVSWTMADQQSPEKTGESIRISLRRTQVDSAMENFNEPMTQVTIKPFNEDGVEGLALSNIKENSIFMRMELRNGDVLVALEGQPFTTPDQVLQLCESLKSSDTINLEINRDGLAYSMKYRIR